MSRLIFIMMFIFSSSLFAATSQPDLDYLIKKAKNEQEAKQEAGIVDVKNSTTQQDNDESDLIKSLLRNAGGNNEEPIMTRVIKGMTKVRENLREKFDTGEQTQLAQAQIIDDLNEAIKASSQSHGGQGQGQGQKQDKGSQQGQKPGDSGQKPGNNQGGTQAATESALRPGSAQNGEVNKDINEHRVEWGNLPARDRSEIVTGHSEEGLPLWEEMISKYYESLNTQSGIK
jgi:hypothetical protein